MAEVASAGLRQGALARVAQRLGMSLAEVDATMNVSSVLDELDLQAYLADVDHEPAQAPRPSALSR